MSSGFINSPLRAHAILVSGALCVSFAPIFVKILGLDAVGLSAIAFWRMFLGGAILFALTALNRKSVLLPPNLYRWAALAGFLFFLDLAFWHRSIMYAGAGMSTILANTQVFNTAVLSFFFLKEKLSLRFFVAGTTALLGVALLVGVASEVTFTALYIEGIVFGLITGVVYAGYLVTLKRTGSSGEKPDFMAFMAWVCVFSSIFLATTIPFEEGSFMPPDLHSWLVLFLLAAVVQALGWWAIYSSLQKLDASRTGLILLMQPTLATIWGAILFAEYLSATQIAGAVITLVAIYYGSSYKAQPAKHT